MLIHTLIELDRYDLPDTRRVETTTSPYIGHNVGLDGVSKCWEKMPQNFCNSGDNNLHLNEPSSYRIRFETAHNSIGVPPH